MFLSVLLLVSAGNAVTDRNASDAVMYIQSITTPALFEVCKTAEPENSADYDKVWLLWSKKHKFTVARGERAIRREAKRDGTDVDRMSELETKAMVSEMKELPTEEQRDRCKYLFEVLRSET